MKEYKLQQDINKILRQLKIPFYHKEKGRSVHKSHSAGFPDLFFVHQSRTFMIELKSETGIVSSEQKEMLKAYHNQGCITRVVFSLDGFHELLHDYNIIK